MKIDVKKKVKENKTRQKKINLEKVEKIKKKNFNLMLIVTFFLGVLLIFSAYAWFNASLDVKVKFINLTVSKKNGLYISLDGIDFTSSVQISKKVLFDELSTRYPNHTSQWARGGLYPVSSKGIPNSNTDIFEIYYASNFEVDYETNKSYLTTKKNIETGVSDRKHYIAFDLFHTFSFCFSFHIICGSGLEIIIPFQDSNFIPSDIASNL